MTGPVTGPVMGTVEFASADGLGVIRLNHPENRNAIDPAFVDGLYEVVLRCAADETLRALLIRAEGPSFTVGADGLSGDSGDDSVPRGLSLFVVPAGAPGLTLRPIPTALVCPDRQFTVLVARQVAERYPAGDTRRP